MRQADQGIFLIRLSNQVTILEAPAFSTAGVLLLQNNFGVKIIVTGNHDSMSREDAKRVVFENGGDWVSSASKNTDYVVVGENPGSKLDQAKKLGVKILDEKEFLRLTKT